jgi:hypothetical protein
VTGQKDILHFIFVRDRDVGSIRYQFARDGRTRFRVHYGKIQGQILDVPVIIFEEDETVVQLWI